MLLVESIGLAGEIWPRKFAREMWLERNVARKICGQETVGCVKNTLGDWG
jgi:hypothetical protein